MKKILITGGAGFIGSHLVEFFLREANQVWVIDNFLTGSKVNLKRFAKNAHFHFIEGDLLTLNLETNLKITPFDVIYHLASPASPKQYFHYPVETLLVNSTGTYKLLEYCRKTSSNLFIYASTSEVYGDPQIHPQKEDYWGHVNPVGVRACYDEGKRFGEALCTTYAKKYHLDIRIARIFNTYGPYMDPEDGRVISSFIIRALQKEPLIVFGRGQQTRSFCYVSDLVKALYLFSQKNVPDQIINLGNPEEKTIIAIARLIKKLTRSSSSICFEKERLDDPKKRKPDIAKAIKLLDWQPQVNLEDGLTQTINYFKQKTTA